MQVTAAQIAALIGGTVEGDPDQLITGPGRIEDAGPGAITFLGNPKYEPFLYKTKASAVLVQTDFQAREPVTPTLVRVDDVYTSVSTLLEHFGRADNGATGAIAETAVVAATAELAAGVSVGAHAVIGAGAKIGENTIVHPQAFVGANAEVGADCILYPGARIMTDCVLGDRCIIQPNAVVGGDGFGFAPDPETGRYKKIPQLGNVILEADVEIGACATVDRASLGSTIVRRGVKVDNHVQIAHNVEVGENTVIAALAGIAGSAKIGASCRIGGQTGIAGHKTVAEGTSMQAQTGITKNVSRPGQAMGGAPAMPIGEWSRMAVSTKQLPAFMAEVRRRLEQLEGRE